MKVGTKTLLFGLHQFALHPLLVLVAFLRIHRRLPGLDELVAIFVHDWGYWGKDGIDENGGENHPYLGAVIMEKLFGARGKQLVLGHSDNTISSESQRSTIYWPDKYYFILLPCWLHWFLAVLSGECREYEKRASDRGHGFDPWAFKKAAKQKFIKYFVEKAVLANSC